MFNQKSIIIAFIERSGLYIYGGPLQAVIFLPIPETIIKDLEVISKDGLYTLIKQWVKQYALAGSTMVFVFSERICFEKVFLVAEHNELESDILKYIDVVPFESTWSKVYPAEKGKRVVVINKALYEALHQGFLLQGLPTKTTIPSFALGVHEKKMQLDSAMAKYILDSLDQISKYSLFDIQENSAPVEARVANAPGTERKKSHLGLLLGVFGVLLGVLGILVFTQMR